MKINAMQPRFLQDRLVYTRDWDFCGSPITFSWSGYPATAGANANDDVSATIIGVIPTASKLISGYLMVSANSGGIDANNTSAWTVAANGTTIISKTNSANLTAIAPVAMTVAQTDIAADSYITLAITNGTNADLNSAACHIALTLADAANYPAPGLKVVATDGGTTTISDGVKGICAISPGAVDNDEIYMFSTLETVKFAKGKSAVGETYVQLTEANTDDANVFVGFMNAFAANALVDNGAGPKATGDYVGIWKVDGGTKWYFGVQSNGTAYPTTDTLSTVTALGTSYQYLRVEFDCQSATAGIARGYVDDVCIGTVHFDYASATEMQFGVGLKNGGANAETLNVDYLCYQSNR